jgi:hypothetical protein
MIAFAFEFTLTVFSRSSKETSKDTDHISPVLK